MFAYPKTYYPLERKNAKFFVNPLFESGESVPSHFDTEMSGGLFKRLSSWMSRMRVLLAKNWKKILVTLFVLFFTFGLQLYMLYINFSLFSSHLTVKPDAGKSTSGHRTFYYHFLLKTRHVLKVGQLITSASSSKEDHCNPKLTFQFLMVGHPLKTECSSNGKTYSTVWKSVDTTSTRGTSNDSSANGTFQLRPVVTDSQYSTALPVCLTTFDNTGGIDLDSLFLTVDFCKPKNRFVNGQQFSVTVERVSIEKSRVFFTIRNRKSTDKWCVGFRNVGLLGKIFLMEQCNGQESQFFYLDAVDYSDEMAEYKAKLMM